MPLPALPPSNTRRLWVQYNDNVYDHSFQLRGRTDATAADLMVVAADFLNALDSALYQIFVLGAEFADVGTNVRNPVTWTGASEYGTAPMPTINAPRELAWEGRSSDGRLTSVSIYGSNVATPADYRFQADESATLTAARAVLVAAADAGIIGTISNARPIWKTYVNFNFNSYYEVKRRG